MEVWMGTHPTERLFFRRLAVEKGEKWRREGQTPQQWVFFAVVIFRLLEFRGNSVTYERCAICAPLAFLLLCER